MFDLLTTLVSFVLLVTLGVVVIAKGPKASGNRLFSSNVALAGTLVLAYYAFLHVSIDRPVLSVIGVGELAQGLIFKWMTEYLVRQDFQMNRRRWLELIVTVIGAIGAVTPFMFASATRLPDGSVTFATGPWIVVYGLIIAYLYLLPLVNLRRLIRRSSGYLRSQARLIFYGTGTSIVLTITANYVVAGLFGSTVFMGYSSLYLLLYGATIAIAIIRYRLLDIQATVARTMAYVVLVLATLLMYGYGLYLIARVFAGAFVLDRQTIVTIAFTSVIALGFGPVRQLVERATSRLFSRDRYDPQQVLNAFSGLLIQELDLAGLMKRSLAAICRSLSIEYAQLVIFKDGRLYRIEHSGHVPQRLMVVPEMRKLRHGTAVADRLPPGAARSLLEDHGLSASFTLHIRNETLGYLLVGGKRFGGAYSAQDITTLEIIVRQLAIAIVNARSYAEIQEFNQTLQARVDHATGRLRVANRHLKDLDHAKDEFISIASHQLRTPLTTIKGYLSMMLDGDVGRISPAQTEFITYAFTASERMVSLISNLLNTSRVSAGRFIIERRPTDLMAMARDEVRQLSSQAEAKGLMLELNLPDEPIPQLMLDDDKTRQVVMNFIDNAIYYTQTGSVTINLERHDDTIRLAVTDTGIGVPESAKKHLFGKFYRAENAQTVRPDGTGLGLYLARRVIEDQGGTIIFNSTEGKGSTFGFELPITRLIAGI